MRSTWCLNVATGCCLPVNKPALSQYTDIGKCSNFTFSFFTSFFQKITAIHRNTIIHCGYDSFGRLKPIRGKTSISLHQLNINTSNNKTTFMKYAVFLIIFLLASVSLSAQTNIHESNGNVGIGITSPDSKLHIYGGRIKLGNIGTGFASGLGIYSGPDATNGYVWMDFTSTNVFTIQGGNTSDNATTPIVLQNLGGKVGIGTTIPNEKLEVAGNIRQSGRTTYLFGANSSENQALMFAGWGVAHGGIYWRGDSRTFTINTGDYADNSGQYGNANLAVTGNLLVGKTSQTNTSYKLDINGNARANKIVVNTTGADFVFEEDYSLRTLEELQKYIRQNKHLPEIPSAKEMEKEGLDVGEMNIKLLQKVEELTLYLIEQNKKLEEQIRKNNDQQREIDALKKQVQKSKY
jgi:hypothetical protein